MEWICEIEKIKKKEWIVFEDNFDEELTPDILKFLSKHQKVKFGKYFNQSVDNLPESLTHLEFGDMFNQPVENLPNSLTHLEFSCISYFNQAVENLPNGLTHLIFGSSFSQTVDNLPISINLSYIWCKFWSTS